MAPPGPGSSTSSTATGAAWPGAGQPTIPVAASGVGLSARCRRFLRFGVTDLSLIFRFGLALRRTSLASGVWLTDIGLADLSVIGSAVLSGPTDFSLTSRTLTLRTSCVPGGAFFWGRRGGWQGGQRGNGVLGGVGWGGPGPGPVRRAELQLYRTGTVKF